MGCLVCLGLMWERLHFVARPKLLCFLTSSKIYNGAELIMFFGRKRKFLAVTFKKITLKFPGYRFYTLFRMFPYRKVCIIRVAVSEFICPYYKMEPFLFSANSKSTFPVPLHTHPPIHIYTHVHTHAHTHTCIKHAWRERKLQSKCTKQGL